MSYRLVSRRQSPPHLAVAVARCGVRHALRHFIRRENPAFVAALVVPEGTADYYRRATSSLIQDPMPVDDDCNDLAIVFTVVDQTIDARSLFERVRNGRQVVIITERRESLPPEFLAGADVVTDIAGPTARHYMAAAREIDLLGMTLEFAGFLSTMSFDAVLATVRPTRPLLSSVRQLKRMAVPAVEPAPAEAPAVGLEDMHGYGPAKDWGLRLAEDIAAWRRGEIAWEDVDRGALLCGPPGCGKTTYAKALAESCGVELVVASAARWQASGHLGDYLKAMRATFRQAKAKAPSILFLDEFDSFGSRDAALDSDNHDYKRQTINGLLECLDPSEGREGVVVIGATNDAAAIDLALLRPGRLEVRIDIPLPDAPSRVGILKHHLKSGGVAADLQKFARATKGWTGADIEKLAREVRRLARRRRVPVTEAILFEAMPERRVLDEAEIRRVAVHEMGHAVVGTMLFPDIVRYVQVENEVPANRSNLVLGAAVLDHRKGGPRTAGYYDDTIAILLGGIAGETVVFGSHSDGAGGDPTSDLGLATDVATRMERYFGLGDTLAVELGKGGRPLEHLRERDPALRGLVEARLRSQLHRAIGMISETRSEFDRLVEVLVSKGRVDGEEVRSIMFARSGNATSVGS